MRSMSDDAVPVLLDPSVTENLALTLGLPLADFVDVFGAGWSPLPDDGSNRDADPEGWGSADGHWYVSGEPYQLALRAQDGRVELGVPVGRFAGSHELQWEAHDRATVDGLGPELLEAAPPLVAALLKRRRARFRYCRYCRGLTPPEGRFEADVCYGCASTWRGVIF